MKLIFKTFNCGAGDCLFLILQKKEELYHIMIDCGNLKDEIRSFVVNDLHKRIDLLVVTHIDNDHIAGLCSLLDTVPDLQIGKILFNCYHRPEIEQCVELEEKQVDVLDELKRRLPSSLTNIEGKISAKKAISLSEKILKNESWAKVWSRNPVVAGMNLELEDGFGKIMILSPYQTDLDKLETQFKKEFWAKFFDKYSKQYKMEEEIYEVLLRLWEMTLIGNRTAKVSYVKLTKETFIKAAEEEVMPVTLPNKCSIAFVYEYEGHRILLLGDSDPEIITDSIKKNIVGKPPYMMDLIKVSHHGSSHSTTKELIETVDSTHYYFTGGNKEERPSFETLSRIITSPLNGQKNRKLHFNRKNEVLKELLAMPEITEFPCIIDLKNESYEIEI